MEVNLKLSNYFCAGKKKKDIIKTHNKYDLSAGFGGIEDGGAV